MKNNNLKAIRTAKGLTQEQVAEMLGELCRTYASWERGERDLPNEILVKLSKLLGTSTDRILGANNEPVPMLSKDKARVFEIVDHMNDEQCRAFLNLFEQK